MSGKILLDTSFVIDVLRGIPAAHRVLSDGDDFYVPSITMGELFSGAERSNRREARLAEAEAFADGAEVVPCDLETARRYGAIESALRARGRPIPDNDIWIAALAQQHELVVVTRDAHFDEVDALPVLSW
ncbi:MAG: type II toxin-antitoxin system VapC family toxin [Gemmatimonadetes bacterium]|nr:type II toxin-antitoxin system VapC family toxin [Gemmatimonadota bacterium]